MRKEGDFYIADRRLYLTAHKDGVVEEGSEEARFLYAVPGTRIPAEAVERFGLAGKAEKAAPKTADKAVAKAKTPDKSAKAKKK